MSASDIDRPAEGTESTDASGVSSQPATKRGYPFWFVLIFALASVMAAVAFTDGYTSWHDKLKAERTEQHMVQRELRAYAVMNDLPVKNIVVTRPKNDLIVTWTQGNQTCTTKAVPPKSGDQLWGTQPIKEGSGQCLTKSGSNGINTKSGG